MGFKTDLTHDHELGVSVNIPDLSQMKTDITHDRVLRISVNIPTKAFCPPMPFLFVKVVLYVWSYGLGWD